MNNQELNSFPLWALLPKRETTAASFLTKYPNFDGRGVKIAILDSGVDPGAAGLQITSDGKPKIIEMMDASGAGDVDTSTVVEADNEGFIKGLTGTKLKIPNSWTNPSGKYHIGVKNIYELFPKSLRERMAKEYTENEWQPMHKTVTAEAVRKLHEFQNSHSDASADNIDEKLIREDLQSKVDVLKGLEKKFIDLGPTYDCVVFFDGVMWRGVIDTSGVGNLEECAVLGNYKECFKYATISERDMLNYAINVHNDGNLLEIVSMSTAHGTHVASIASAYFPNEPEKNGVAPGAQIVSIGIGDSRLGSMETGSALIRALIKVIESGCDVINMSYGEHGHYAEGRVLEMIHEVVNKYGVVYVSSAGNHGPALSTIGTPPTMHSSSIIGVGAYVSPDMMTAGYSMRSKLPGMGYSWTSRGPTLNGDLGVSVCAPGGAITSVPNWTLKKALLMNGTSMSSPNVAGCVALLLSGLKAQNIPFSPYSIRRSLENTALKIANYDPLTHGHGLIQVEKAFEHLTQFHDSLERDIRFHITTNNRLGVYLRQPFCVNNSSLHQITVEPIYLNDKQTEPKKKVEFDMNLSITCDDQWVTCPTFLNLTYSPRTFTIKIDPQVLEAGTVNFSMIRAFDVKYIEKGPIFQIPVTVIKPMKISDSKKSENTQTYKPGFLRRQFFQIPSEVTSVSLKLKNCDTQETGSFILHLMQIQPQFSCKTNELFKFFTLAPQAENSFNFQLTKERTLEVCFGKWWSSIGETQVSLSLEFHGLQPSLNSITMLASECITRVDVNSNFAFEEISPTVSLKNFTQPLRPNENKIRPLYKRDIIHPGRQIYEILLSYSFQLTKANDIVISCPLLSDLLYESEYESQLWMLFDVNKQLLGVGDAYPSKYSVKLEKGDYVVRLQVRHENVSLLEKLTELPIQLQYKLANSVSLNLYETYRNALIDGKKFSSQTLKPYTQCPIFISSITELPKNLTIVSGSYFSGNITFAKEENRKKTENYSFKYIIDSEQQKKANQKDSKQTETNDKPLDEQFSEALKDLKITWLSKLTGKTAQNLYNELQKEHKNNIPLILARIQSLDADEERSKHLKTQISLANELLDLIKVNELLASFAILKIEKKEISNHNNSTNSVNNNSAKNLEKQKANVLEALVKKGIAICDLIESQNPKQVNDFATVETTNNDVSVVDENDEQKLSPTVQQSLSDVDQVFTEITKLIDPYDSKVAKFTERHASIHCHFGRAIKLLFKLQETKPTLENELKCVEVFKQIGWTHCVSSFKRSLNVKFPKDYRLF